MVKTRKIFMFAWFFVVVVVLTVIQSFLVKEKEGQEGAGHGTIFCDTITLCCCVKFAI
jgi:hypothetical protein